MILVSTFKYSQYKENLFYTDVKSLHCSGDVLCQIYFNRAGISLDYIKSFIIFANDQPVIPWSLVQLTKFAVVIPKKAKFILVLRTRINFSFRGYNSCNLSLIGFNIIWLLVLIEGECKFFKFFLGRIVWWISEICIYNRNTYKFEYPSTMIIKWNIGSINTSVSRYLIQVQKKNWLILTNDK